MKKLYRGDILNMEQSNVYMKNITNKTHTELYKELEYINVKEIVSQNHENKKSVKNELQKIRDKVLGYIKKVSNINDFSVKSQCESFYDAMKIPLMSGQCAGLIPVIGITEKHNNVRFTFRSLRFIYCCILCVLQTAASLFCLYEFFHGSITVRKLGNFAFFFTTCITSILFLQLATKWKYLLKQVSAANLNEYVDLSIKYKCSCATAALLGSAVVEHLLLIIARISVVLDCEDLDDGVYAAVIKKMIFWSLNAFVTANLPCGLFFFMFNFISTINWSYSHVFIICISLYLTSILDQINKKIVSNEAELFRPQYWDKLRSDYNRATRLVREFDDVINPIIFFSIASNLFFICLQLYNTLSNVSETYSSVTACPRYPSGPFYGYELITYYVYSLFFIIIRFLAVALVASRVHTASTAAAPSLYSVSSTEYCIEVDRFIRQVQGNFTALSGLNFFYVTKELILSVAGTVVTYELVLLQLDDK